MVECIDLIVLFPTNMKTASEDKANNSDLIIIAKPVTTLHDSYCSKRNR